MTNELNAKLAQYGIDYAEAMERLVTYNFFRTFKNEYIQIEV